MGFAVVDLRHRLSRFRLAGLILQNAHRARSVVFNEIDINCPVTLVVGRRQDAARLRVALGLDPVGDLPVLQINDDDRMPAIRAIGLCTAAADVGAAIVNRRRGSGANLALQIQAAQRTLVNDTRLTDLDTVEIAASGTKVVVTALRIVGDIAAHIPGVGQLQAGQDRAGPAVQAQQRRAALAVAVLTVVSADDDILVRHARASPIEAALGSIEPTGRLLFLRVRRILIRSAEADEVAVEGLAAPEAGVDIAVVIGDRAVRLAKTSPAFSRTFVTAVMISSFARSTAAVAQP